MALDARLRQADLLECSNAGLTLPVFKYAASKVVSQLKDLIPPFKGIA
jgi:hypothetical protein